MFSHLSKKLRDQYEPPRENEVRIYRLTNIRKKKSKEGVSAYTLPNSRSLPDSYLVIDGNETKTVVYTTSLLPTKDPAKTSRKVEPIEFRMDAMGEIRITPQNYPLMSKIDKYLYFSPWVVPVLDIDGKSNRPWQVSDKLGKFIELVDNQAEARKLIDAESVIFEAQSAIKAMSENDMDITILQLKLGMPKYLTIEEKTATLVRASKTSVMAKRITALQGEEDMTMRRFINEAVNAKIIKKSKNEDEYVWTEGAEVIVKKMPGKTLDDSLIFYFKTEEGGEVKVMIELTIEAKGKKPTKSKTATTTI